MVEDITPATARPKRTGQSLRRSEDRSFLQGTARFTADVQDPALADACFAAFVRSPVAAGTIVSVDATEAAAWPGVVAVLTGADIEARAPFALPMAPEFAQPLLPRSSVGFAGEAVAMVVAETEAQAVDAAEAVIVDIEPGEPVLDIAHALETTAIEETRFDDVHEPERFETEVTVALDQWSPRQLPCPIEGRAVAAAPDGDRLLVWSATQTPHAFRGNLARLFDIDSSSIRVVASAVGGGFGGKVSRTTEEYLVPLMARRLGRAVRWNETRSEYFATATQGRGELVSLTLAGTADGRMTALRARLVKDAGAYPLVGVLLPQAYTAKVANGCYDIAHVEFSSVAVRTNRPATSAYRGAGRSPYIAALERVVDRFAAAVGIDPAEVRKRNLITPDQMPFTTPTAAIYDEADYPADLQRAIDAIDYPGVRAEQKHRRETGAGRSLGLGIACYNHMTTGGGGEEASVTVEPDGGALVVTGTTSQGHGHATTWAQIASDVLGIDVERIRVIEGDTDRIDSGVGAVGSRSLQTAGMAIHRAATEVVEQAKQLASELLEASAGDIVLGADGLGFHVVGTPARSVSWAEVVSDWPVEEITCGDFYDTEGRNTFPSGAHIAVVEVDTETGRVELQRLVAVDDAGTMVNPMIVAGQLHGGIAQAVGQVLGEVIIHDELGNQVTSSLLDYPIPSIDQLPNFEIVPSATATSFNQLGFKGVGESGTVGATGAVHNAVIDAVSHLGVEHLDLPCTPERVWLAIQAGGQAG